MPREHFDFKLDEIRAQVLAMGSEVEENLLKVTNALLARNALVAQRLIDADERINERRITLVLDCLRLIATQQPMAKDMRLIVAVIEIAGELERIHDYVKGIARTSLEIGAEEILPVFTDDLPHMARLTQDMLSRALMSFAERNAALARSIPPSDDLVDDLFNKMYADIVRYAAQNSGRIAHASKLEWVVHNMERSADRVINICEWVIYMVSGVYLELDSEHEAPPPIEV